MNTVPMPTIAGMFFSLIVSVALPIVLLVIVRKKTNAKISSFFLGAATFIVFALILEQLLHLAVLRTNIQEHLWLYAIYGGCAAAVFEECGRFFTMKILMKKTLNKGNALMYGVGHGGIEAIIIIGLAEVSNIATSFAINGGNTAVFEGLDDATLSQIAALWETPSYQFFLSGVERILAIALHICMSYLVFRAVKFGKTSNFCLALLIHFLVDAATVLISSIASVAVVEVVIAIADAVLIYYIVKLYKEDADIYEPECI